MDKAKAYDEALKRARKMLNMILDNKLLGFPDQIREIFPQLRESNDERIREELIEYHKRQFENNRDQEVGLFHKDAIAYLEKQKEETENATKTLAKILEDSAEGFRRILKKKGIDYEVSDKFWENEAGVYSKEENVKFHKWMDDLMGPTPVEETNAYKKGLEAGMKQKEQKPVDDKAFEEWIDSWFKEHKEKAYPQITMDEKEFKNFCRGIRNMYQQKSDWNEEDERMLSRCIKSIECSKKFADSETYKTAKDVEINWLKDIYLSLKKHNEAVEKLWSNEWSEKDEEMRNALWNLLKIQYAQDYSMTCVGIKAGKFRDWLKSLCPSWKPNEEQIEALERTIHLSNFGTEENRRNSLLSLLKELKKLGVEEEPEYYQHFDPDC